MDFLPAETETIIVEKKDSPREYRNLSPEQLVDLTIDTGITHAEKHAAVGGDESFFVVDLGEVSRQHRRWKKGLPNVQPYYGKHTHLQDHDVLSFSGDFEKIL
jgi:hypothetical protein